jgi:hypothetical protein
MDAEGINKAQMLMQKMIFSSFEILLVLVIKTLDLDSNPP